MRNSLPVLLLCFFIFNTAEAQHRIGFGSSLHNSEYVPSLQYELQLSKKWSFSTRGSYYTKNDQWYGFGDLTDSFRFAYMEIKSVERGEGYGIGFGFIRSDFIVKNLSFEAHVDLNNRQTRWLTYQSFGLLFCCRSYATDFDLSEEANIRSVNPNFGIAYSIQFTDQFFIKPVINFGKEYILTEVNGINLENQQTKTFGVLIGTSF